MLLSSISAAQASMVLLYNGFPGNADTGSGSPFNFSGGTLVGSFFAPDINFGNSSVQWNSARLAVNFGADITEAIRVAAAREPTRLVHLGMTGRCFSSTARLLGTTISPKDLPSGRVRSK
jgi:hypothetical protein